MRRRRGTCLALVLLLAGAGGPAHAAAEADSTNAAGGSPEQGWLARNFQRYFGSDSPSGTELAGQAVEVVDRYTKYAGRPIEVVIINQVARFDRDWGNGHGTARRLFDSAAKPFQTYTRDSTIRQYVLFAEGEPVDPFLIADTERLLRGLDYIEDVRIFVVPLTGAEGSVAVVIETRDRWPFGASAVVKDVGRYEAGLFSSNVAGLGLRFDNRVIYRDDRRPKLGYQGSLRKRNLDGTFVDGSVEFEDSYRRNQVDVALKRELSHPTIAWVGGASWRRIRERDSETDPDEQEIADAWLGNVIRLRRRAAAGTTARPVLVPALRFTRRLHLERPPVSRDTLRRFHNRRDYLAGVTYQRFKYYKTSYLFEMGETEDIPSGLVLKLSGGYQESEFDDRVQAYWQSSWFATRSRGDVAFARLDAGGFFRNGSYEDGSLIARAGYITPLADRGGWRSRVYSYLNYHRAINRASQAEIWLGDETGLRGMEDRRVRGNQRLVGNFEYRLFAPWSVWGFRFMWLAYLDVGTIAGEDDDLFGSKFYGSAGLAVRIGNPDLVLPPLQMRVALRNSIDDKGILFSFRIGGSDSPEVLVPGTRPGGFTFR